MLCVNHHANPDDARYCQTCGVNQFLGTSHTIVYTPAPRYNSMAIASIALFLVFIPFATPIVQIVLGTKARREIQTTGEQGDGLALAGIILGWLGLVMSILFVGFFIFVFVFAATHSVGTSGSN